MCIRDSIDTVQWPENRPALLYAAKLARTPYQTIHGPDVLNLRVTPPGPLREMTATLDSSTNGNRPIAAENFEWYSPWAKVLDDSNAPFYLSLIHI